MATCIDDGSLEVNDDGKLEVRICGDPADEVYPGGACSRNLLKSDPDCGLHVRERRPTLRRRFTAVGSRAVALGSAGAGVARTPAQYVAVENTGSPAGLWTVQGNGTILINCAGVYLVSQQTIVEGSTGVVVGGRARVANQTDTGAVTRILCSTEINYRATLPAAADLSVGTDGPEFNSSAVRGLAVGAVLEPISNVYMRAVNQQVNWSGEFVLTYLGETA